MVTTDPIAAFKIAEKYEVELASGKPVLPVPAASVGGLVWPLQPV
jgi:hypothetical protein